MRWFEGEEPDGYWWWAIEHKGHPAFYLRNLLPGDFAPGREVAPRHVLYPSGAAAVEGERVACATCGENPSPEDLVPIERSSWMVVDFTPFRTGEKNWPPPTDPASCWLCCGPPRFATIRVKTPGGESHACKRCAPYLMILED